MIPLDHPLILMLAGAVLPTIMGILAYRRGVVADKTADRAESERSRAASVALIIQGLNDLLDSFREDNKDLREQVRIIRDDARACAVKLELTVTERDDLLQEVKRLTEKIDK